MVHQRSYNNTPQQNRVVEQKNKHHIEDTRAPSFTSKVPIYLWGEAIFTVTYLLSRMPNKIPNFKTPLSVFQKAFPMSKLPSNLSLKAFGYITFVHILDHNRGKFDTRARKCVCRLCSILGGIQMSWPYFKENVCYHGRNLFQVQIFFWNSFQGETPIEDSDLQPTPTLEDELSFFHKHKA